MTGRQLNPTLPSKGCIVFCPHEARGGQRTGKISSQRSSIYMFSFFVLSHPPPSLAHFSMSTDPSARGSEGGGEERGKDLQKRGIFHNNKFRPCIDFCSVLQSCLHHFAEKS